MPTPWPGFRAGMKRVKIVLSGCAEVIDNDVRQDALKPGHLPFGPLSKHPLHVNAEVNRGLAWRAVP